MVVYGIRLLLSRTTRSRAAQHTMVAAVETGRRDRHVVEMSGPQSAGGPVTSSAVYRHVTSRDAMAQLDPTVSTLYDLFERR